jgi:3',5'-cyclic AMP phosphodiesterase CpdA
VINSNQFDDAAQTWLSDAIAASSATWKIVAFHHPIFNNGTTHPDDEKGIYSALRPIICGKADLLLSGHEHLFSHLRDSADGCGYDQLIVGTGGRDLYSSEADPRVLYTESNFGVGYFEVTAPALTFQFLRATGEEAYSFVWHK